MNLEKKIRQIILLLFAALFLSVGVNAAGDVDLSFDGSVQNAADGPVYDIFRQSDGKIIIAGNFTAINGYAVNSVARLNTDGTVDTTFNSPASYKNMPVYAVAVQSSGKVLIGLGSQLKRLNTDGSEDLSFVVTPFDTTPQSAISDIELLPDDKFYVGGSFNGTPNIFKFNADGPRDNSFNSSFQGVVKDIEALPGGKVIIGGFYTSGNQGFLIRLSSDGSVDATFSVVGATSSVEAVAVQSDGKILLGGTFTGVNGDDMRSIARVNSDGTMDPTFNPGSNGSNGSVYDIQIRPDGKILVGGKFTLFNGVSKTNLVLLNSDGTLDASFTANLGNIDRVETIELNNDGKILVGTASNNPQLQSGLTRLNADGSTDTSTPYYVSRIPLVRRVLEQPDGKILVAGEFNVANNIIRNGIARFNADGTLDPTFTPAVNQQVNAMALQPDGKIVIGSYAVNVLRRLNSDGSIDAGFNPPPATGEVNDIVVLPDGKILIGGQYVPVGSSRVSIARFNSDGSRDTATFTSSNAITTVQKIYLLPSGKFLAGGHFGLRRYNENGTTDSSFQTITDTVVNDIDVQADGKIIVVGGFAALAGNPSQKNIGRITADGFSDPTFSQTTDGSLFAVKIQPDGKILVGGLVAYVGGTFHSGMFRLNTDGAIDSTFTANTNDLVFDVILLNSGQVFIGGRFTRVNGISKVSIARLNNNLLVTRTPFDFDGDGRTDISVYRPSNSVWYQLLGPNYQFSSSNFGSSGDLVASADYDGDGKTDLGIFRPSTGTFWYAASGQGGAFRAVQWGQDGDVPMPSDFNGDGKDDFVVYRPSNNTWYRLTDTGVFSSLVFGTTGDKPLIGDFDGDGKTDYAIFRPSSGQWWYAASSAGNAFRAVQWGQNGDLAVPADYDGDGTTDLAVYRPSNGVWYILNSGNNSATIIQFGLSADKPVAGDYDGDGKADIGVYRPTTGEWFVLRSTAGFFGVQFGISEDIPIPNAFIK